VYRLAEQYGKPVAIHMGQTAMSRARLKYAHPLLLDEVATEHPNVQFVMCHFGNPFLPDAAAVAEKNPNVAVDLSGLLEGYTDLERYQQEQAGYLWMLKGWIAYVNDWSKFMFGTDFPAVNLQNYANFGKLLIPQEHWEEFFFHNANRIYQLGL
jgi:predicted TIM-barrel fold metal-dependent hydrolase